MATQSDGNKPAAPVKMKDAIKPWRKEAPWWVVNADNKKLARLNCISHLLAQIPYEDLTPAPLSLPPRQSDVGYIRPPITSQSFVPEVYPKL